MTNSIIKDGKKIPLCVHCIHGRLTEVYVKLTGRTMELPFCHIKKMVIHDCESVTECSAFKAVIPELVYGDYEIEYR